MVVRFSRPQYLRSFCSNFLTSSQVSEAMPLSIPIRQIDTVARDLRILQMFTPFMTLRLCQTSTACIVPSHVSYPQQISLQVHESRAGRAGLKARHWENRSEWERHAAVGVSADGCCIAGLIQAPCHTSADSTSFRHLQTT